MVVFSLLWKCDTLKLKLHQEKLVNFMNDSFLY